MDAFVGCVKLDGEKTSSGPHQKVREYLEDGNEVIPKSSPLQGMKAQSMQSLFVVEVTHGS